MKLADLSAVSRLADRIEEIHAAQKDVAAMSSEECRLYLGPQQQGAAFDVNRQRFHQYLADEELVVLCQLRELGVEL